MAKKENQEKLEALRDLETEVGMVREEEFIEEKPTKAVKLIEPQQKPKKEEVKTNDHTIIEGYKILQTYDLPNEGKLYPQNWKFAYRCPTTKEVANFSTVQEGDHPAAIAAIEELVRKCVKIIDVDTEAVIPSTEINDSHKLFFMLKLRDFYLPGAPIDYDTMCDICHNPFKAILNAESLIFSSVNEKLLSTFDGRRFTLVFDDVEEPIVVYIPTIGTTSRLFKYIVKVYRDMEVESERVTKDDKIVYDKKFLLLAPYLFETGRETIKEISNKYNELTKDDKRFKAYMNVATSMKLDNLDVIDVKCSHCGSVEETPLKFPGGWSKFFIGKDTTGYFG